jgi:hypothetical protein
MCDNCELYPSIVAFAIGYIIPPPLEAALGIMGDIRHSVKIILYATPMGLVPNLDMRK